MPYVNKIKRTITTTACLGKCVNEFGEFEDFCDVIPQDVDCNKASVILRKKWHNQSITINALSKETHCYEMSVEEFIASAREIPVNTD